MNEENNEDTQVEVENTPTPQIETTQITPSTKGNGEKGVRVNPEDTYITYPNGERSREIKGVQVFLCEGYSTTARKGKCNNYRAKNDIYCKDHTTRTTAPKENSRSRVLDVNKEVRALRRFLRKLTSSPMSDPKLLTQVNNLIDLVRTFDDKHKATLTVDQLRQIGFYFGSILFNHIQDGTRYEIAKKEFLSQLESTGLFTPIDLGKMTYNADANSN